MKIVILTQYFPPEMGAPQNRLLELALGLKKLNWEVQVITALPNYPTGRIFEGYRGKVYVQDEVLGITTHRYWLYPSKSSRAFPRIVSMLSFSLCVLASAFKLRKIRADYLLVESPPLPLGFSGWLLARFSGSKFMLNVSDLWPLSAKELGAISDGFLYKCLSRAESFLYARADWCSGQSQEIVDYILKQKTTHVLLFRNGVDTSRFEIPFTKEKKYKIVYAGLLGVAQGILELCKSVDFKEMEVEFHIYGSGNEAEALEKYLLQFPDRGINYKGTIERNAIPITLAQYDVALIALVKNIYGAVPSKVYEAMAAGLPILFSGSGEGGRIILENELGWVNAPCDWSMLSQNITRYKNLTEEELSFMKNRVRRIAKEKFDRSTQVLEFHKALMAGINQGSLSPLRLTKKSI